MNYENEPWYKMLAAGYGADFNMRNLASVGARNENQVLSYVMRSLDILEKTDAPNNIKSIVKIVLQWSEVARGGTPKQRDEWLQKGYDLHSHNVGSADIYREWNSRDFDKNIYHLIRRRATIGQIIQGEVPFDFARELHDDLSFKPADLRRVLMCLEQCVIGAVRPGLFDDVRESVVKIIDDIVKNKFPKIDYSNTDYIRGRIDLLHKSDDDTYLKSASTRKIFGKILSRGLWYFGAAMDVNIEVNGWEYKPQEGDLQ